MQKSKFFIGLTVLLIAAIGAFASIQRQPTLVHYISGNTCLDFQSEEACFESTILDCQAEVEPGVFKQLYAVKTPIAGTNPVRYTCSVPLERENP